MYHCTFKGDEERRLDVQSETYISSYVSFRESSFLRMHFRSLIAAYHLLQEKSDLDPI